MLSSVDLSCFSSKDQAIIQDLYKAQDAKTQRVLDVVIGVSSKRCKELEDQLSQVDGGLSRKKTKLDEDDSVSDTNLRKLVSLPTLSYSSPMRKKLSMIIYSTAIHLCVGEKVERQISLTQLRHIICVPTPEKVKVHWSFIMLFEDVNDTILFTLPDEANVDLVLADNDLLKSLQAEYIEKHTSKLMIIKILQIVTGLVVQTPSATTFRGSENEMFVKCHLKAKAGFLFALEQGLLFGFSKPLTYIPFSDLTTVELVPAGQSKEIVVCWTDPTGKNVEQSFLVSDIRSCGSLEEAVRRWRKMQKSLSQATKSTEALSSSPALGKRKIKKSELSADTDALNLSENSSDESDDSDYDPTKKASDDDSPSESDSDCESSEEEQEFGF